jgi:hypothetical protein
MDYQFHYLSSNSSGRADGSTSTASALLTSAFISDNFTVDGPTGFGVESCNASVDFTSLNFHGKGIGLVSALQTAAEPQLLEALVLESELFVCEALTTLNLTIIEFLQNFSNFLNSTTGGNVTSPSEAEAILSTEISNTTLLSFSNPQGSLASVINFLVQEVTSYLGSYSNATDLYINDVMRSSILNNDGSLSLNASFLFNVFDGAFFTGGSYFAQSYLVPETMQIFGLDTFTNFSTFQAVDNHTLQANFSLDSLTLLVSMVWELPDTSVENVTLQIDLGQVIASADLLIAIDQDLLGALPLGSLLNSSELFNCIFSTLYDTQITNLLIEVGELGLPKVGGFESSPGSKLIASTFISAVYDMLHYVIQYSLPGFFQSTGAALLTNLTSQIFNQTTCPDPSPSTLTNGLVDMRDFLLSSSNATALGGTGTSPYGDVASSIKGLIDSLLVDDSMGSPGINSLLIGPLTQQQSGIDGTLSNLVSFNQYINAEDSVSARIRIELSDVNIENIAVGDPFFLLDPVLDQPYLLNNTATIGINDTTPVQVRADFFFHWDGDGKRSSCWV